MKGAISSCVAVIIRRDEGHSQPFWKTIIFNMLWASRTFYRGDVIQHQNDSSALFFTFKSVFRYLRIRKKSILLSVYLFEK